MPHNYTPKQDISAVNHVLESGQYIQSLFDPIQTHAIYGITSKDNLQRTKSKLKGYATHFRQVKNHYGWYILCFRLK